MSVVFQLVPPALLQGADGLRRTKLSRLGDSIAEADVLFRCPLDGFIGRL